MKTMRIVSLIGLVIACLGFFGGYIGMNSTTGNILAAVGVILMLGTEFSSRKR